MTVFSGEWKLLNGKETPIGSERWSLKETPTLIVWHSVIDRNSPFPHREELSLKATPRSWKIESLKILSTGNGRTDKLQAKRNTTSLQCHIHRDSDERKFSMPMSDSTEIDYLSPVFNTVTFHRLRLRRRESREIEAVYISPVSTKASFEPRVLRQSYQRLKDENVSVPAGNFPSGKRYVYKNLESGWTGSVWTDNLETVLRYESFCELLQYSSS
jgi:hypothetical protein